MSPNNPFVPVSAEERIISLDITRGFVVLGILLMNITGFGLWNAYENPTVAGGATGLNLTVWTTMWMFFEGTMRGLFSLLFGVGMYVLTTRLERKGAGIEAANIYFRRLLWLIFFGLVHSYLLLWFGEILYAYGLMGLLLFSFRHTAPRKLILYAVFLMLCGTLWSYFDYRSARELTDNAAMAAQYKREGRALTPELTKADEQWTEMQRDRAPEYVESQSSNMRRDYLHVVKFVAPLNMKFDTTFLYRHDLWDVFSMMLLGIAFFRWKIVTAERSVRFYLLMAVVGYAVGLAINYYEWRTIINDSFSHVAYAQAGITYLWGRTFTAIGHLAVIMLFCKSGWLRTLRVSLASVGKMALTNYLMHSVICMFVFTGAGFALFGKLQRYELYYVVLAIWIFQLVASPIWLKYFQFGPVEWLWRSLTYQKRQPFLKSPAGSEVEREESDERRQDQILTTHL